MSTYFRNKAYDINDSFNPGACENKFILEWWSSEHDELLLNLIKRDLWYWYSGVSFEIIKITPEDIINSWKEEDPLCSQYAWFNLLTHFARCHAEKLGLTNIIRPPEVINCLRCKKPFLENSLPEDLAKRLGPKQIDVCGNCFRSIVNFKGIDGRSVSKCDVISYIQDLTKIIERIPPKDYGEGYYDFLDFSTEKRMKLFNILRRKVNYARVNKLFGSWFHALVESDVLDEDSQRMVMGTKCLALDGHLCFSLGEKTIDDFLYHNSINHEKEPPYPEGKYRADFKVNDTFIEYFGLRGQKEYDKKTQIKKQICQKYHIKLIEIYPENIGTNKELKKKLKELLIQSPLL